MNSKRCDGRKSQRAIGKVHLFKQAAAAVAACFAVGAAQANPTNPVVANGAAQFTTAGNLLSVTNTPNTIINWGSFSIGANEITRFIQQSSASAVLNRVGAGRDPSSILGALQSNGRVFLINPNGITFGAGSQINVAGLVASTLNLSDADFLAGRMRFTEGLGKPLINNGSITTGTGGNVYLVGNAVTNNGIITSPKGEVILAAGNSVELVNPGTPDLRVEITAPDNQAVNLGQIVADSGRIGIYAGLINHGGTLNANSVDVDAAGNITLKATKNIDLAATSLTTANGATGGSIAIQSGDTTLVTGTIEARGSAGQGGNIHVLGNLVGLTGNASIDASGDTGGGTVLIGGDFQGKNTAIQNAFRTYVGADATIKADAISSGDGGKVIVWSDDATRAYGSISARGGALSGNGGFIETSGKFLDVTGIRVNANAVNGAAGKWLLDPNDLTIQAAGVDTNINAFVSGTQFFQTVTDSAILTTGSITAALDGGTSVEISTLSGAPNTQLGNITINDPITKSLGGNASLTFTASNNINVNANITSTAGTLGLVFTAPGATNIGTATINTNGGTISAGTGTINFTGTSTITASTLSATTVNANAGSNTTLNAASTVSNFNVTDSTVTLGATLQATNMTVSQSTGQTTRVTGAGNINLVGDPGTFTWSGGTVDGGGTLTTAAPSFATGTTSNITGAVNLGRDWTMNGPGSIGGSGAGSINIANGKTLTVNNTLTIAAASTAASPISGTGTIDINGTLQENRLTEVDISSVTLNNKAAGTISNTFGNLLLGAGTDTAGSTYAMGAGSSGFLVAKNGTRTNNGGTFTGGGFIQTNGGNWLLNGSVIPATARLAVNTGTMTVDGGPYTVALMEVHAGGTLTGNANLTGPLQWDGGTISGTGTLSTTGAGGVNLSGSVVLGRNWSAGTGINLSGAIDIGSGSTLTIPASQTMAVTSSGGTVVSGLGTLTFTEGVLNVNSSGTVTIAPAVFNTSQQTGPSSVTLTNGTLRVGSTTGTDSGTTYSGVGGLEFFQGTRTFMTSGCCNAAISTSGGVTFSGANVSFINTANYAPTGPTSITGGSLTFASTATYNSTGAVTLSGGALTFNQPGTITIPNLTVSGGALAGTASLSATGPFNWSGGTMDMTGALTTGSASNISASDSLNGAWTNNGTANITGGALTTNSVSGSGTLNVSGGATAVTGAYSQSSTTVSGGSILFNNGSTTFTGGLNLTGGTLGGTANLIVPSASVFNWSGGILGAGGTLTTNTASTVSGLASLKRTWISAGSPITIASTGTLDLSGGAVTAPTLNVAGLLKGAGTVTGNVINSGTVAPGASPGVMNIVGDYTQSASGTLQIELGGLSPGAGHDQLVVSNNVFLNGTLLVTQFGSFIPGFVDTFKAITAGGSITGAFSTVTVPLLFAGLSPSYGSQVVQLGGAIGLGGVVGFGAAKLDPLIVREDKDIFAQFDDTDIFKKLQEYLTCN